MMYIHLLDSGSPNVVLHSNLEDARDCCGRAARRMHRLPASLRSGVDYRHGEQRRHDPHAAALQGVRAGERVRLNWVVLGESALRQRLTVDIATGGDTFDLITIGSYETPLWAARGWLVPVDDLGADYDYDDIFEVIRQGLSWRGKLYAAPFYGESSFTYYRKDLFEKFGLAMPRQPSYEQIRAVRGAPARPGARRLRHLPARRAGLGPERGVPEHLDAHLRRAVGGHAVAAAAYQPALGGRHSLLRRSDAELWASGLGDGRL